MQVIRCLSLCVCGVFFFLFPGLLWLSSGNSSVYLGLSNKFLDLINDLSLVVFIVFFFFQGKHV